MERKRSRATTRKRKRKPPEELPDTQLMKPVYAPPDKRGAGNYSDHDKATALVTLQLFKGNYLRTAKYLNACGWNISERLIQGWDREEYAITDAVKRLQQNAAERLVMNMERILEVATTRVLATLDQADFRELIGAISVVTEKMQLLKEEPTSRVRHDYSGMVAQFNQRINLLPPGGDGESNSEREREAEKEIVLRPANGRGKPDRPGSYSLDEGSDGVGSGAGA